MTKKNNLERLDHKFLWHPFTQMEEYEKEQPLIIEKGEGCYLVDIYGKRYFDGISSLWTIVHGHNQRNLNHALMHQSQKISHSTLLGLSHPSAIKLAEKLVQITPGRLTKVFYSDNGSTAVEIALKMAFQYWQQKRGSPGQTKRWRNKTKFIHFSGAYHGDTIGSVSVGGMDLFHKIYHPLLFRSKKIPYPHCYRCPYKKHPQTCHKECVSDMKRKIRQYANETAALIMEPLQGASGMRKSPRGYFKEVERACQKHRVLLIVDEVATGFGRTGKMFACEHERVQPDLLTLAKGLTGGYLPLAATLTTQEIYQAFKAPDHLSKTFFHGHTYTGNPLASGLALENIRLFQKNGVLKKLKEKIQHLRISLSLLESHPHVGDIRQCGFMVGIELVKNKKTKKMFPLSQKVGARVCHRARHYGVILRPLGDVIVLMPPLSATKRQLTYLCRTVLKCLYDELGAWPKNA